MFLDRLLEGEVINNDYYRRGNLAPLIRGYDSRTFFQAGKQDALTGAGSSQADAAVVLKESQMGEEDRSMLSYLGTWLIGGEAREAIEAEPVVPISEEDWRNSNFFREDITYEEGMTYSVASMLADRRDIINSQEFVMQQADAWDKGSAILGGIVGAAMDVKSWYYSLVAAGAVVGAVGAAGATAAVASSGIGARALLTGAGARTAVPAASKGATAAISASQATLGRQATAVAAEGVAAGLLTAGGAAGSSGTAAVLGEEYSYQQLAADIAAGVLLSGAIHVGQFKINQYWNKYKTAQEDIQVSEILATQDFNGEPLDVLPVVKAQLAQKAIPLTTLPPTAARSPDVVKVGKFFEASYEGEDGLLAAVKGKGKTKEEAVASLEEIYNSANTKELYGIATLKEFEELLGYRPTKEWFDTVRDYGNSLQQLNAFSISENTVARLATSEPSLAARLSEIEKETMQTRLAKADANTRLSEADSPSTASLVRDEIDKLNKKEAKLQNRGNEIRETPAYRNAQRDSNTVADVLREFNRAAYNKLIGIQSKAIKPDLQAWVKRQTVDTLDKPEAVAPVGLEPRKVTGEDVDKTINTAAADNRNEIQRVLEDENAPAGRKEYIREQLAELEETTNFMNAVNDFVNCLGGSRG